MSPRTGRASDVDACRLFSPSSVNRKWSDNISFEVLNNMFVLVRLNLIIKYLSFAFDGTVCSFESLSSRDWRLNKPSIFYGEGGSKD